MQCVLVDDLGGLAARLHHHATTHSIEGIRHNASNSGNNLSDGPADVDGCVLGIGQHAAGSIVEAKVCSTVDDDTLHGNTETTVQSSDAITLEDLAQAVAQTGELASSALASISSQTIVDTDKYIDKLITYRYNDRSAAVLQSLPSTSKVQWVDKAQRSGTSSTTGGQVADEVTPELGVLVNTTQEDLEQDKIYIDI